VQWENSFSDTTEKKVRGSPMTNCLQRVATNFAEPGLEDEEKEVVLRGGKTGSKRGRTGIVMTLAVEGGAALGVLRSRRKGRNHEALNSSLQGMVRLRRYRCRKRSAGRR